MSGLIAPTYGEVAALKRHFTLLHGSPVALEYLLASTPTPSGEELELWLGDNIGAFQQLITAPSGASAVAASSTAMAAVAASSTAMAAVAASSTAMAAVAASSTAMAAVIASSVAQASFITNSSLFQENIEALYTMVQASWVRKVATHNTDNNDMAGLISAIGAPVGLVFATLGGSNSSGTTSMYHPQGSLVRTGRSETNPVILNSLDGVSFNGAYFEMAVGNYRVAVELWSPV